MIAERIWPNLLLDGFYLLALSVSAMFFIAAGRMAGARWSAGLRRIPEAIMLVLPLAALLMVPLVFGRHTLFPWSRPDAWAHEHAHGEAVAAAAGKVTYLQVPFVFTRMAVVLIAWGVFAWLFRRTSLAQDREPTRSLLHHQRLNRLAGAFLVLFALSITTASYDWIASLDPGWFSTMFSVYVFAGTFVQGIAAITLATVLRMRSQVGPDRLHDLGKMLFAFSTFWAYIWTCQYLLIWYGNLPEEVGHYITRTRGGWLPLFAANVIVNWVFPFIALLSARSKRNPRRLAVVCVVLLLGRWLDLYLLIMPSVWAEPRFGPPEILIAAVYAGLAVLLFKRNLAAAPLVPLNDPVLAADAPAVRRHSA